MHVAARVPSDALAEDAPGEHAGRGAHVHHAQLGIAGGRGVRHELLSPSYLPIGDKLSLIERSLKELDLYEDYTLNHYLPGIDSRHEFALYMRVLRRIRKQLNKQHKWASRLALVAWEQAH